MLRLLPDGPPDEQADLPELRPPAGRPAGGPPIGLARAAADPGHGADPVRPVAGTDRGRLRTRRRLRSLRSGVDLLLPPRSTVDRPGGTAGRQLACPWPAAGAPPPAARHDSGGRPPGPYGVPRTMQLRCR